LLLTNNGVIYAFGDNYWGQLGFRNDDIKSKPVKLIHRNKFIDIASHFDDDISVSLSDEGNYYVWGDCKSKSILTPMQTVCKSFNEVFSKYTTFQINATQILFDFNDSFFSNWLLS
jgi:alpha-tubulin suppressor-like RCC1 family protein